VFLSTPVLFPDLAVDFLNPENGYMILVNSSSESENTMAKDIYSPPFDALDHRIIQELRRDVRADAAKIARAVGANQRTVRNRIERLIDQDVIRPAAIVNPLAFGYVTVVDIFLQVELEHEEEAVDRFLTMQEVAQMAYGLGQRDMMLRAYFKDNHEMREFLRHTLPSIPGVKVTGSILVPHILRNIEEWMPRLEDFGPDAGNKRVDGG
jgi:Lrp/AsnC family transcriptional regulator for asnA, asnC and gidA